MIIKSMVIVKEMKMLIIKKIKFNYEYIVIL